MMSHLPAWIRQHLAAVRALLVFTVLCGALYPLVLLGVAQAAFPHQANGSLVRSRGVVTGSALLCQEFRDPAGHPLARYFQPRPSAATSGAASDHGCDPLHSGASDLAASSQRLAKLIERRKLAVASFNHVPPAAVPPDAVTASGSGLDPYISPGYAAIQERRVAAARRIPLATVRRLVARYTQGRVLGVLGEPRVNVLLLNIALNQLPGQG